MPKNYEKINLANPDHEEEERLFKNDKSHDFVPLDQVVDEEPISVKEIPEEEEFNEEAALSRITKDLEEIYVKNEDGVASVGPDVDGEPISVDHVVVGEKPPKENKVKKSRRVTRKTVTSMSAGKLEVKGSAYHEVKKDKRNTGEEKDNLKTMPDSKKQKTFRQKIRDFFNKPI